MNIEISVQEDAELFTPIQKWEKFFAKVRYHRNGGYGQDFTLNKDRRSTSQSPLGSGRAVSVPKSYSEVSSRKRP